MGIQKPVKKIKLNSDLPKEAILGSPIAEHHGKKMEKGKTKKKKIEEKIKEKKVEEKIEAEEIVEEKSAEVAEKPIKKVKIGKAKIRSRKYQEALKNIDRTIKYPAGEAIELVKKTSFSKFDGNVEAHIRLIGRSDKPEQVRGLLQYPHSTGQKVKVIILDPKKIEEILKTGKTDFDLALATPALMPQVVKLAKILGPEGKMPNPKSGTITENPQKTLEKLKSGQQEFKTDSYGIVHQVIGKVSSNSKILEENLRALLAALPVEKISSISMAATMGPGVKVQL